MNIEGLYLARIYVNTYYRIEKDLTIARKGSYVKTTIVFRNDDDEYVDLESDEKYKSGIGNSFLGDMYISLNYGLIPIRDIPNFNFNKRNMSKRRILKKISEAELLNKKEDDK